MKKAILIIALATAALVLVGCGTTMNTMGAVRPYGIDLVKLDYKVLGDTTAEATRTAVFGIDWAHLMSDEIAPVDSGSQSISIYGIGINLAVPTTMDVVAGAKGEANLEAIKKVPNADRLLDPRYVIKESSFGVFFHTVTVTVTAKAIQYTNSAPGAN
jgi:hypothetical protein